MNIRSVIEIRYAQIRNLDLSNGEGVGVALFVQGCHFHCFSCFNPETWDFNGGKEWTEEVKNKFLELVDRPYIKRISILGGEPLAEENIDDVLDLVYEIRLSRQRKTIWLYTGFTWENIFDNTLENLMSRGVPGLSLENECEKTIQMTSIRKHIVSQCNILVDGQYMDSQRDITLPYRGSKNQRLIDIQQSLQKGGVVLWQV